MNEVSRRLSPNGTSTSGSFAVSGTSPLAPRAGLRVEVIGVIALPLSEREANLGFTYNATPQVFKETVDEIGPETCG